MQTTRQAYSPEFVYLLHAAAPRPVEDYDTEAEEGDQELDEDLEDDGGLEEIDFDD